jgi:hypothetical protein
MSLQRFTLLNPILYEKTITNSPAKQVIELAMWASEPVTFDQWKNIAY